MIDNGIAKKMVAYFDNVKMERDLTSEERELYREFKDRIGTFVVTCVTRDDLESMGFDASNVDDATMMKIANKMGDAFNEDGIYWDSITYQSNWYNVPVK